MATSLAALSGPGGLLNLPDEVGHLDGGHGGLEAFVAGLQPGAVDGLFQVLDGQDAEGNRDAGFERGGGDALGGLGGNVFEVRRLAANDRAEAQHRVILSRLGEMLRGDRDLKRAGNPGDGDRLRTGAGAVQAVERPLQQPFRDEGVEPAHHNGKTQARRGQLALEFPVAWRVPLLVCHDTLAW